MGGIGGGAGAVLHLREVVPGVVRERYGTALIGDALFSSHILKATFPVPEMTL